LCENFNVENRKATLSYYPGSAQTVLDRTSCQQTQQTSIQWTRYYCGDASLRVHVFM